MRTVLGVIVGYLVFAVSAVLIFRLTGHAPHEPATVGFMVLSIVGGMVAALIGGYIAATLAGDRRAASAVAIIIAVLAIISAAFTLRSAVWSNIAAVLLMAPAAQIGGRLARTAS